MDLCISFTVHRYDSDYLFDWTILKYQQMQQQKTQSQPNAPLAVPTSLEPLEEDNNKGVNGSTQLDAERPLISVDHQRTVNNGSSMPTAMPRVSAENVSKPQHGKGETISREEAQDPAASIQQQYAECITAGGKRSHHREGMECTVKKQSCTHMELLLPQPGVCLGLQHNRHGPTREDGMKKV
ncbi:uncharacterized protein HKW66_Vig0178070 [Vigna angularis]|uniref:Uncharacterized protein n=1 Tax=Phaseolus angularis TaxID=3914 RepID=A0A8T0JXZ2_PHAAN|nr:uncharacterized protein HKW66_Vig0178070 [Vigna angularis]